MNSPQLLLPISMYIALATSGCSVAMAVHGTPEPNFNAFEVGSSRQQVEIQLGKPAASQILEDGKTKVSYRYEIGNAPNGDRALMNFYIDFGTILLWEFPATIIEATMGEMQETEVTYNKEDRVLAIEGYIPPEPSEALKKAREDQKQFEE